MVIVHYTWRQALPQDHPCRINGNLQTNRRRQADMAQLSQENEVLKKKQAIIITGQFFNLITLFLKRMVLHLVLMWKELVE